MFLNNLSRYKNSSAYNQLLIAHVMSEIIFMKCLPPVRFKLVPTLKVPKIFCNLAHLIFQTC